MDYTQQNPTRYLQPTRQEGFSAAVGIPLLQSLVTGALCGMSITALCWALEWPNPGKLGLVGSLLITTGMWAASLSSWMRRIERILGVDLNGDGYIGQVPMAAPPESLRIEVIHDQGRSAQFIDLPSPDKLPLLAAGLLAGRQFSQSVWTGQSGIFSRSEFEELRAELLKRNLARWKNADSPSQGVELTPPGRAVFRRLAQSLQSSPTLPKP